MRRENHQHVDRRAAAVVGRDGDERLHECQLMMLQGRIVVSGQTIQQRECEVQIGIVRIHAQARMIHLLGAFEITVLNERVTHVDVPSARRDVRPPPS